MATSLGSSVTIDRAYFDTLLRRADFNKEDATTAGALPLPGAANLAIVNRVDYDGLQAIARQYANLQRNLMNGGVTADMIAVLSQDEASSQQNAAAQPKTASPYPTYKPGYADAGGARLNPSTHSFNPKSHHVQRSTENTYDPGNSYSNVAVGEPSHKHHDWADADGGDDLSVTYSVDGAAHDAPNNATFNQFPSQTTERPYFARLCKRTVVLVGLPDGTTHWDVTQIVRGGLILEVYMRAAEHSALVSFLREDDAVRFYEYVRRNDLYINHKRVFIKWADRHFHLAGHVAGKIGMGATRNMVIRRCDPKHTEETIRDDLEHIHNLIVIKVEFLGGSCYIKTNSVHNAMFARTCMMSRIKYKGSKIDWDVDECEQPLEVVQKPMNPKPHRPQPTKKSIQNRFATLRLDDDDDETDDRFDTSSDLAAASTVDVTA